jgi:hypothetical protein
MSASSTTRTLSAGLPIAATVAVVVALGGAIAYGADAWFVASLVVIVVVAVLGLSRRPGSVILLSLAGLASVALGLISLFSVGLPLLMGGVLLLIGRRSRTP